METDEQTIKDALKQAAKEWMSERLAELGWFSLKTVGAFLIGGLALLIASSLGWHK